MSHNEEKKKKKKSLLSFLPSSFSIYNHRMLHRNRQATDCYMACASESIYYVLNVRNSLKYVTFMRGIYYLTNSLWEEFRIRRWKPISCDLLKTKRTVFLFPSIFFSMSKHYFKGAVRAPFPLQKLCTMEHL